MKVETPISGITIANARLPEKYETAKSAIAACEHIDECKDWADKAEALASYAKQAGDESLLVMAKRIQARAIRRCGDLLLEIQRAEHSGRPPKNGVGAPTISKRQAAREAGLSKYQQTTAVRVARVPAGDFDAAVEAENPATVTALADLGKKTAPKPVFDLQGRDPEEFKVSTDAQGALRGFAETAAEIDPAVAVRGALEYEWDEMLENATFIVAWCERVVVEFLRNGKRTK